MFTIEYKGSYINCYCDKSECKIAGIPELTFKSIRSAKCFITKHTLKPFYPVC